MSDLLAYAWNTCAVIGIFFGWLGIWVAFVGIREFAKDLEEGSP